MVCLHILSLQNTSTVNYFHRHLAVESSTAMVFIPCEETTAVCLENKTGWVSTLPCHYAPWLLGKGSQGTLMLCTFRSCNPEIPSCIFKFVSQSGEETATTFLHLFHQSSSSTCCNKQGVKVHFTDRPLFFHPFCYTVLLRIASWCVVKIILLLGADQNYMLLEQTWVPNTDFS